MLSSSDIGEEGRFVRCSYCDHEWIATLSEVKTVSGQIDDLVPLNKVPVKPIDEGDFATKPKTIYNILVIFGVIFAMIITFLCYDALFLERHDASLIQRFVQHIGIDVHDKPNINLVSVSREEVIYPYRQNLLHISLRNEHERPELLYKIEIDCFLNDKIVAFASIKTKQILKSGQHRRLVYAIPAEYNSVHFDRIRLKANDHVLATDIKLKEIPFIKKSS